MNRRNAIVQMNTLITGVLANLALDPTIAQIEKPLRIGVRGSQKRITAHRLALPARRAELGYEVSTHYQGALPVLASPFESTLPEAAALPTERLPILDEVIK